MNCREYYDRDGDLMYSQSGAYATDTSVNTCITMEFVGRQLDQLVASSMIFPEPPITHRKTMRAYSVANVFSCSVATQLR